MRLPSLLLLGALGAASLLQAAIYDAVGDFSITNGNPNGVWSYGDNSGAGGVFSGFSVTISDATYIGWQKTGNFYPNIRRNITGATINPFPGEFIPTDSLYITPDHTIDAIVLFTAPISGSYSFFGEFLGLQGPFPGNAVGATGAGTVILNGSTVLVAQTPINGLTSININFIQALIAGDTVAFRLLSPDFFNVGDSLGLRMQVAGPDSEPPGDVPEPATLAITGLGLLMLLMRKSQIGR